VARYAFGLAERVENPMNDVTTLRHAFVLE